MSASTFISTIFREENYSTSDHEKIVGSFQKISVKKGDFLIQQGETSNHYWFVEEGFLRSFVIDYAGNDISTHFYSEGNIAIDWSSFFQRKPTLENIQALTDCSIWQVDFDSFQELFHSIRQFREEGRARLVGSYFSLKAHSISLITDPAKERYLRLIEERPHILKAISLKQIASYLGITDTSLSRIRKEIASE